MKKKLLLTKSVWVECKLGGKNLRQTYFLENLFSKILPALQHAQLNYWICIPEYIYYSGKFENHIQKNLEQDI